MMNGDRIANVCFHGIGRPQRELEPGEESYWISVEVFHDILDALGGRSDVALSFDDGNITDLDVGLPALLERQLTATFFPLAGRLDQPGSLTSASLVELRRSRMRIGSHGMDHIPWRGLEPEQQRREFVLARERLAEASGGPVLEAALPLGRYDRSVLSQLKGLGYARVYSSDRRSAKQRSWLQPRYSVRAQDTAGSFCTEVLRPPSLRGRLRSHAVGMVKRLR
jgi:peptidoglycan/xylan/chitin deacetylase (PgdA/CDA1 family)